MRPPIAATVLGVAGLLPATSAVVIAMVNGGPWSAATRGLAVAGGIAYGGLILSFLGGIWWGIASVRAEGAGQRRLLVLSVMPSLIAAAILCVLPFNARTAGGLMGAAIVATLLGDRRLAQAALVPGWWLGLRVPLSAGLGAAMIALALLA